MEMEWIDLIGFALFFKSKIYGFKISPLIIYEWKFHIKHHFLHHKNDCMGYQPVSKGSNNYEFVCCI